LNVNFIPTNLKMIYQRLFIWIVGQIANFLGHTHNLNWLPWTIQLNCEMNKNIWMWILYLQKMIQSQIVDWLTYLPNAKFWKHNPYPFTQNTILKDFPILEIKSIFIKLKHHLEGLPIWIEFFKLSNHKSYNYPMCFES